MQYGKGPVLWVILINKMYSLSYPAFYTAGLQKITLKWVHFLSTRTHYYRLENKSGKLFEVHKS
jgi:hypothetical protein